VFSVSRGKVLVCLVSMKGIKASPDKINAIVHMKPLGSRKEVLRGSDTFEWGPEQQEAFDALKEYIQKVPRVASPQSDQPLILYVSATHTVVSGALVQ
jgi:hypothetical protein